MYYVNPQMLLDDNQMYFVIFSVNNCRRAMEIARREFNIPVVLEPEYLASPHLDELSGMTYLSYFMKEDSPGFHATLRWVNSQLPDSNIRNFTVRTFKSDSKSSVDYHTYDIIFNFQRDWNSGMALCHLVRSLGGPIPGYKQMTSDQSSWENNLNLGKYIYLFVSNGVYEIK